MSRWGGAQHESGSASFGIKILSQAGFLKSKRIKQWTFYKRDEAHISKIKRAIIAKI
jgi:hypothetical protein